MNEPQIIEALRAGAPEYERTYQAGLNLLLWLGKSLPVLHDGGLSGTDVRVDLERLRDWSGVWSGGERRVVRVALSLMDGDDVNLNDVINGLGGAHVRAVVDAIAAASGLTVR